MQFNIFYVTVVSVLSEIQVKNGDYMKKLWSYLENNKAYNSEKREKRFMLINTCAWFFIAFLCCMAAGVFYGYSEKWIEWSIVITGYAAIFGGLIGGFIFCGNTEN